VPTAPVNGVDLYYEVRGEGPTLLMAHGLMGSIEWSQAMGERPEALARHFRLVTYDARGHGRSGYTTDPGHYTWNALAEDMYALMRHLGIERAHVGGGSMGAGTALMLALDHPEMVQRLVLVAPPPLGPEATAPVAQLFGGFASAIERLGLEQAVEAAMNVEPLASVKDDGPEMVDFIRRWLLSQNPEAVVPAIRGVIDGPPLPHERFGEITVPTLIIAHPDDDIHPLESARVIQRAVKDTYLVVAPTPTYHRENPDEVVQMIVGFLAEAGLSSVAERSSI
jgi:2-succinyl-6-hydroxy-2,4-cyclohexadiene-1-carboxylate synthase